MQDKLQLFVIMRRFLLLATLFLLATSSFAQNFLPKDFMNAKGWTQKDSLQTHLLNRINQKAAPGYKLYPTDNMWTFIELETKTGRLWQVHYSVKETDGAGVISINSLNLALLYGDGDSFNGRFELYKTQNMYNFILLDTVSGAVWQAQWSFEASKRGIIPLEHLGY